MPKPRRHRAAFLISVLLWVGAMSIRTHIPASAHAELIAADPEPGAQLADSPQAIRLTFSEPIAARSRILLFDESFQPVEDLTAQFDQANPAEVYAPLPELEPGTYTVQWSAVAEDGHELEGAYSFSVGLITPAPAVPVEAAQESGGGVAWWLIGLLALAVGLSFLFAMLRRRSRV